MEIEWSKKLPKKHKNGGKLYFFDDEGIKKGLIETTTKSTTKEENYKFKKIKK